MSRQALHVLPIRLLVAASVLALVAAMAALVNAPAEAASPPPTSRSAAVLASTTYDGHAHASDEAHAPDAALIAKVLGTSDANGADWQSDQQSMADFNADLTKAAGDRYVGLSVPKGAAEYSTTVRLSGNESDQAVESIAASAAAATGTAVTVEYVDAAPIAKLLELADSVRSQAKGQGIDVGDVWVDERTSQIVAEISSQSTDAQVEALAGIAAASGEPYRLVSTDDVSPSVPYLTGGASMTNSSGGLICTAGFTVVKTSDTSVKGLSTAAHCQNPLYYKSPAQTTPVALTFQSEAWTASADVQWHRRPNATVTKAFWYDGPGTQTRSTAGARTRTQLSVGMIICSFGRKTNSEQCGYLLSKTDAAAVCGTAICTKTWLKVGDSDYFRCRPGDSGGPLFDGNYAAGILNSGTSTNPSATCWFMSTDYFSSVGVKVYH